MDALELEPPLTDWSVAFESGWPAGTPELEPAWPWSHRKRIDLSIPDENLTDFPVCIKIVADAKIGAGCLANGHDIRFTAADGVTELPYEREVFSGGGGAPLTAIIWVKSDVSTAGTYIWIYYGNAVASDGETAAAVWDDDFKAVYHMKDATTSTILDSTGNGNNGTKKAANEPIEAAGKIGKGQDFDGFDDFIDCGNGAGLQFGTGSFSVSGWINQSGYAGFVEKRTGATGWIFASGPPYTYLGMRAVYYTFPGIAAGAWHYWSIVIDRATALANFYVDGVFIQSADISGNTGTTDSTVNLWLGKSFDPTYVNGLMDELRISSIARSAAWLKFEYRNMSEADGGLTWGAEIVDPNPPLSD